MKTGANFYASMNEVLDNLNGNIIELKGAYESHNPIKTHIEKIYEAINKNFIEARNLLKEELSLELNKNF
ncbi:hypothetical protein E4O03_07695 [Treponema sp. OMZ 792]|uniref:hypothetical protein n=1 Tax=unclassified Treponema TaxID=2638727 RepID=UPI0020A4D6C7|nr:MULTISPECIES: hypothetical protein [unclassified Treponema]UTC74130.1 hypothetical protein E4O03_07695 [Treponema sp. OMZ 792]UTC80529.1 hypothetical protein E4O07_07595 [Treponema sp. OMZ 798]